MKVKDLLKYLREANPEAEVLIYTDYEEVRVIASIYSSPIRGNTEINKKSKTLCIDVEGING